MYYLQYVVLQMAQERAHKNQKNRSATGDTWISALLETGIRVISDEVICRGKATGSEVMTAAAMAAGSMEVTVTGADDFMAGGEVFRASLWITDDEHLAKECVKCGRPVLGVLTKENAEQSFEGVSYLVSDLPDVEPQYLEKVYRRQAGIPWDILETERCLLRETTVQDADAFYKIYADPSITEFMEDLPKDRDAYTAWLQDYAKNVYEFFGYGIWTICLKQETLREREATERAVDDWASGSERAVGAWASGSEKAVGAWASGSERAVGAWASGSERAVGDWASGNEKSEGARLSGGEDLTVIGRAGLTVREGYDSPELGFVIGKSWQGQGLAYEVCSAILEYARELGIPEVIAFAKPENKASLRLLQKLGFRKIEQSETKPYRKDDILFIYAVGNKQE